MWHIKDSFVKKLSHVGNVSWEILFMHGYLLLTSILLFKPNFHFEISLFYFLRPKLFLILTITPFISISLISNANFFPKIKTPDLPSPTHQTPSLAQSQLAHSIAAPKFVVHNTSSGDLFEHMKPVRNPTFYYVQVSDHFSSEELLPI